MIFKVQRYKIIAVALIWQRDTPVKSTFFFLFLGSKIMCHVSSAGSREDLILIYCSLCLYTQFKCKCFIRVLCVRPVSALNPVQRPFFCVSRMLFCIIFGCHQKSPHYIFKINTVLLLLLHLVQLCLFLFICCFSTNNICMHDFM